VIADDRYHVIAHVRAGAGERMDFHEFQLTPQGTALIDCYRPARQDTRGVPGGRRHALVMRNTIEEIDVATGKVLFRWVANRHIAPQESYLAAQPGVPYDYIHVNSVNLAADGDLIVSARHTHTIYEVDRRTGAIVWRLGGKRSDFHMGRGTRTRWQHDAVPHPDGTITAFDNEADEPTPHRQSRGVQLRVDAAHHRVTLVRQWRHDPAQLSVSQGDLQLQPNGDALIGWGGGARNLTEYGPSGDVRWEARFARRDVETYRAYRFPWSGLPHQRPRAVVQRSGGTTTVYASYNGATGATAWRVLGGPSMHALTPRVTAAHRSFETRMTYAGRDAVVVVEALDAGGAVLGTSKPQRP
jgi:hypothetical protein